MKGSMLAIAASAMLALFVVPATPAQAQDHCRVDMCWCPGTGVRCTGCGGEGGEWNQNECTLWTCPACLSPVAASAFELAKSLSGTPADAMPEFLAMHRERVLINRVAGAVVILGADCSTGEATSPAAMAYLSDAQLDAITRSGALAFEDFVSNDRASRLAAVEADAEGRATEQ